MNRYSQLSTSHFDPLSLEEVMAIPTYKEQKYNELAAQQAALHDSIKVDPLDVHKEEAQRLKHDFESKLDAQSAALAKSGDVNAIRDQFLKSKREYNTLTDPTGRIGQINAAKQVYNLNFKNFMDSAEKQGIGSQRALDLWKERNLSNYTGYDQDKNIKNINELGVAAKQDYETDRAQLHAILGKTSTSAKASGYHFEDGPNGTVMVDKTGNVVTTDNFKQLQDAEQGFKAKWLDNQGEGSKYAKDAGLNITPDRVSSDLRAMRESSIIDNRGQSTQFIRDPKAPTVKDETSQYTGTVDPQGTRTIGEKTETYDFSKIGKTNPSLSSTLANSRTGLQGKNAPYVEADTKFTYKDIISDPIEQKRYENTYHKLIKEGKIHSSRDMNDPLVAQAIQKQMSSQGPITIQSRILRADIDPNAEMFMGKKLAGSKDAAARNTLINQDLNYGFRNIIDPSTGTTMSKADWKKKVNDEGWHVEYVGYDSPFNWRGYKFGNDDQQVMAHKGIIKDKDGKIVANATISRTEEELKDPNFKVAKRLNQTYRNMTIAPNDFVNFSNKDPKYKGTEVMYKTKDESGNEQVEPTVLMRFPSGSTAEYSLDQFTKLVSDYELKHK